MVDGVVKFVLASAADVDRSTVGGECKRSSEPKTGTASRDERDLAREIKELRGVQRHP